MKYLSANRNRPCELGRGRERTSAVKKNHFATRALSRGKTRFFPRQNETGGNRIENRSLNTVSSVRESNESRDQNGACGWEPKSALNPSAHRRGKGIGTWNPGAQINRSGGRLLLPEDGPAGSNESNPDCGKMKIPNENAGGNKNRPDLTGALWPQAGKRTGDRETKIGVKNCKPTAGRENPTRGEPAGETKFSEARN
jgi:hypothetical protein